MNSKIKDLFYFFFIFILLYEVINIWFGIDSIFDEGFLLLKYIENTSLEITQSFKIVNFILQDSISISRLKGLRIIIQFIPLVFILIQFKDKDFKWILIMLILPSLFIYTNVISYNHLSSFYLIVIVLTIFSNLQGFFKNIMTNLLLSVIFFLAVITIPPFGFLLSVFYLFFIYRETSFKQFSKQILILILCGALALLTYSLMISNLFVDFESIMMKYQNISSTSRGYSKSLLFIKLAKSLLLFSYYWCLNYLIIYSLSFFKITDKMRLFILIIIDLLMSVLFKESDIFIFILPIVFLFFYHENKKYLKYFILLFLPLIFSFGTNTEIHIKAIYYIVVWALYLRGINFKENINLIKNFLFLLFISNILFYSKQIYQNKDTRGNIFSSRSYFKNENIKNIGIREKQKTYLQNLEKILHDNNIGENPTCLGFQLEHMTFYVFNLQPLGVYFQPTDFIVDNKRFDYSTPKLLFLNDYEFQVISSDSVSKKWMFPAGYKKIPLGTPEDLIVGYSTNRNLYVLNHD